MEETIDIGSISLHIGMPVAPKAGVSPKTMMSMCETVDQLARGKITYSCAIESSGIVENSRDMVLADFLEGDKQKLLWLDSDMVWTARDVVRFLALSAKHDVICATYPAKVDGIATFYVNHAQEDLPLNQYGLLPVYGAGLGFTIVDRKAMEAFAATKQRVKDQITGRSLYSAFRQGVVDGHRMTEDFCFFSDLRELGYTIWLDPSIKLGHIGEKEWTGDPMTAFNIKNVA